MAVSIKYKGKTVATARNGQTVELDTKDHKFTENLFVESYGSDGGGGSNSGNGGFVLNDVTASWFIATSKKTILGNIPVNASVVFNEINNLSITKGE